MAASEYGIWQALDLVIRLGVRANEEVRLLARSIIDAKGVRDIADKAIDDRTDIIVKKAAALSPSRDPVDYGELIRNEVARQISATPKPKDGIGVKEAFIGRHGELIMTFDDGTTKNLGAGFANDINPDAIREMIVEIDLDNEKGIWEPQSYKKAHRVTYGGSRFLAKEATLPDERPAASEKWVLINKRGRDGKDAETPRQPRPSLPLPAKSD